MQVLLLVATALYAGFQWTIRLVVYPQLAAVPVDAFVRFEARHQRLVTYTVGPLFVFDGAATIAAFATDPSWSAAAAGACLAVVLAVTAFGAVPQHRVLTGGFDAAAYRRLLAADTVRLTAAAGALAAAVCYSA